MGGVWTTGPAWGKCGATRWPSAAGAREPVAMESYEVGDVATHLERLLERVEAAETIVITDNGRPVAQLVPAEPRTDAAQAVADLRAARETFGGEVSVRELMDEFRCASHPSRDRQ